MKFTQQQKDDLKKKIARLFQDENEVTKIIVFGSFLFSDNPNDLDLAIFQNSQDQYLPLAIKYRKKIRQLNPPLSVDILPLRVDDQQDPFLAYIRKGEVIYER